MKIFKNNFSKFHLVSLMCLLAIFTLLTFLATNAGLDKGPDHNAKVILTTALTITGPMTGAISRGFQSCCLKFSLSIAAYCIPFLAIGILALFINQPDKKWIKTAQSILWILGWLIWLAGGIVSFGHALS